MACFDDDDKWLVLNASFHQAETIKTRLEQQMDNLDVTDTHYDKKISDLQRRLDAQYDRIDEVEETMAELTASDVKVIEKRYKACTICRYILVCADKIVKWSRSPSKRWS